MACPPQRHNISHGVKPTRCYSDSYKHLLVPGPGPPRRGISIDSLCQFSRRMWTVGLSTVLRVIELPTSRLLRDMIWIGARWRDMRAVGAPSGQPLSCTETV